MNYLPKLRRLAERNMSAQLKQRIGSDDMADSILASIVRMNGEGKLSLAVEESNDFWRLLVVVALNKIRKKARFHNAAKRDMSKEIPLADDKRSLEELAMDMGDPNEDHAAGVSELLNALEQQLDPDENIILAGRILGESNTEIAQKLNNGKGMSTKSVTRKWKQIEQEMLELAEQLSLG